MKARVVQNKLQLNDEKTDSLIGSAPGIVLPSSLCVGQSDIPFCNAAHNIDCVCVCVCSVWQPDCIEWLGEQTQLAYLAIRPISSIQQFLLKSPELSRPDYCNAHLAGSPRVLLLIKFKVINYSARLIFKAAKSAHITTLQSPLATKSAAGFKIALICFYIVSGRLVQLLYTSVSCFISTLLLAQSRILGIGSPKLLGWAGPHGRAPFNTSDLWSELSSLCQAFIFTLLSQNWKNISSAYWFVIFFSHCTNPSPVTHVFVVCVCEREGEVCVCVGERERQTDRNTVCVRASERVHPCICVCVSVCVMKSA